MYKIVINKSALKELQAIQKETRLRIIDKIEGLAVDPRPPGIRKLENSKNSYRIRIGNYRVIYQIEDSQLIVNLVKVADRKQAYRNK